MGTPKEDNPPTATAASDEALFERFQTHADQEALGVLCDRYQDFAYRVAYAQSGNVFLAEETVQEAFLQLARRGTRFQDKGPESFRAWFYGVIMNLARNLRRVEHRAQQRVKRAGELERVDAVNVQANAPEAAAETRVALGKALEDLQEDLRLAVVLHCAEGLTQAQVGQLMGVSQPQVARRVAQGLEHLRKRLALAGVALSASAIPHCLRETDLLRASANLRSALSEVCGRASQGVQKAAARSVRRAAARGGAAGKGVIAAAATILGVAVVYLAMHGGRKEAPPQAPAAAGPVILTWNFDQGMGNEFATRNEFLNDGMHALYSLPEWQPKGGLSDSGALKFSNPGCSMLIKTAVPTARLPIHVEFEMLVTDADKLEIGIAEIDNRKNWDRGPPPKSRPDQYRVAWKAGRWVHVVREITLHNGLVTTQTLYDGVRKGDYREDPLEPAWTDPAIRQYFEIYGYGFVIDGLKLTYGPPAPPETH
ncbi:MAG: RNA polymerase sigma factor [Planctomycetes bacterium]|nr:RNA polymerase sigma factor [Planctomycetota bacterium]